MIGVITRHIKIATNLILSIPLNVDWSARLVTERLIAITQRLDAETVAAPRASPTIPRGRRRPFSAYPHSPLHNEVPPLPEHDAPRRNRQRKRR